MTTEMQIRDEIARQTARLQFTTDPQNARILRASIDDLVGMLKGFPTKLLWMAAQSPEAN